MLMSNFISELLKFGLSGKICFQNNLSPTLHFLDLCTFVCQKDFIFDKQFTVISDFAKKCFFIYIVDLYFKLLRPDPPVSLNWTLLNISPSGLNYDVLVSWKPPPSADVGVGWMRIEYEIQYRERNATNWEAVRFPLEKQPHTQQTIYGLQIGKEYEVHIRSRMQAFVKFGEFSDSIFIEKLCYILFSDSTVPFTLVLIFGVVGVLIVIMLIVISQQQRIMMILLPPVPAPKIKGIDSELLKKGKLEELNFILNGGGVDGLPAYATDFYQEEPWVEFIEVDEEDAEGGDKEDNYNSDTQSYFLIVFTLGFLSSHPDDDSGRASCYDTDLPEHLASLLPGQPEDNKTCLDAPASETGEKPLIQTQIGGPQTWINTDLYAQVSNVMPSGGVVLSPDVEGIKEQKRNEPQFQLFVLVPEGSGYQTIQPQPMETKPAATGDTNESPYILPEPSQSQLFTPVADYTVVQELDTHRSLLLNPPHSQSPSLCQPQHPLKVPMPVGYVTPDLLGNLAP
uniref:Growth hormone receptor a n=1 Tax=Xiphophorus couchianus TaxID=32473 RepID=A0A3B5LIQ0_9TELE